MLNHNNLWKCCEFPTFHKKLEKWEKQFKRDNPQYFEWNYKTAERMEKDKEIKEILEMWNST